MPRTSRSSPPASPLGSAASEVFHVPELVALIVCNLTSGELYDAATLSKATAAECQRLLDRSPSVIDSSKDDSRLASLARALKRRPGKAESFTLACTASGFPSDYALASVFECLGVVSELTLTGQYDLRRGRSRRERGLTRLGSSRVTRSQLEGGPHPETPIQ